MAYGTTKRSNINSWQKGVHLSNITLKYATEDNAKQLNLQPGFWVVLWEALKALQPEYVGGP